MASGARLPANSNINVSLRYEQSPTFFFFLEANGATVTTPSFKTNLQGRRRSSLSTATVLSTACGSAQSTTRKRRTALRTSAPLVASLKSMRSSAVKNTHAFVTCLTAEVERANIVETRLTAVRYTSEDSYQKDRNNAYRPIAAETAPTVSICSNSAMASLPTTTGVSCKATFKASTIERCLSSST